MEKHNPPLITQHRLHRLILWTLAVLGWFAAVMFSNRDIPLRRMKQRADFMCVPSLTRHVTNLLIVRALHIVGRPTHRRELWRHNRFQRPSGLRRKLLGAKLRRALKLRDIAAQIAQLISILRNLNHHAARLAHAMRHKRRRLTRIVPPIAPPALLLGPPASSPTFSDSS